MPNQFFSPEGDLENYFVTESWLIDQYIGDTLWGWGSGATGVNSYEIGQRNGTDWAQVTSGLNVAFNVAAVKTDGTLWTWGTSNVGQIGNATQGLSNTVQSTPVTTFTGGTNWKQVSMGNQYVAAIKTDGSLWTWGNFSSGRLGRPVNTFNKSTPITTFAGGTNWADTATTNAYDLYTFAAGGGMGAAIKTDGTLWIWGTPGNQARGTAINFSQVTVSTPMTTFAGGTNWKQISFGRRFGFTNSQSGDIQFAGAVKTDGTLWTWGYLGNDGFIGTRTSGSGGPGTPVTTFAGGTNWRQLSCGTNWMSALKTDGTLWAWGNKTYGQLGTLSASTTREQPITTFAGGTNWADTATTNAYDLYTIGLDGSSTNGMGAAIKTDGTLWVWGKSARGQLGIFQYGSSSPYPTIATPVTTFVGGTNWKQVVVGCSFWAGAIKTDGTLWTWGYRRGGKIGDNQGYGTRNTPGTTFAGGTNWKQVAGGYGHIGAIKTDGTLWTWGHPGYSGRLGNGVQASSGVRTPITTFAGGTNWNYISSWGSNNAVGGFMAIKTDGTLWAWGNGSYGALGNTITSPRSTPITLFAGGTNWKQISVDSNGRATAAVKTDGTLWVWGNNSQGRLGNATVGYSNISTPVTTFAGGTNWKQVSMGLQHVAAIKTDGTLWTWGNANNGRLGNSITSSTRISTPVTTSAGGTSWNQVIASYGNTIATRGGVGSRELFVFGNDASLLALNYNQFDQFNIPGTTWAQVSSGDKHVAAIKTDGTLWTWGYGNLFRLGNNSINNVFTPVTTFAGGTNWKQVSCGLDHTAAVKTDGTLWSWGSNMYGQLGDRRVGSTIPVTTFAGGTNWKQVACGRQCTQAIKTDGTLWTWGNSNNYGLLGISDSIQRSTPVTTFAGGTNWKQVTEASSYISMALNDDGVNKRLFVWGNGDEGRLGSHRSADFWIPVEVSSTVTWKQVSSGINHAAAVKTDGTLWLWGSAGAGSLGVSDSSQRDTPVTTFAGGTNWKQVSCGYITTAAIKTDGTLWIWGLNANGQLGNNNTLDVSTPITTFTGGTNWKQVSCGQRHISAIKTDGTLWIWGNSNYGQLGNSNTISRSTPVTTFTGGTNWKQVGSGQFCNAAIKTDGTLWVWGSNNNGQLGNSSAINRSTPVTTSTGGTNWKQVSAGHSLTAAVTSGISADLSLS